MDSTALRWKATTVVLPGFLLMIFLISGTSALTCQRATSVVHCNSEGKKKFGLSTGSSNITCSADENACVQVQLELSRDGTAVFVSHRDCARKDLNNGSVSATVGDQPFAIQSNVSYCLGDLCNVEMTPGNVFMAPGKEKAPEASGSNQCYSGFNFEPSEPFLEKVTCGKGSNQCSQGESTITVGPHSISMYTRSCQNQDCAVPQSQSFGPVTITIKKGSCCTGSYCNAKEVASQAQDNTKSVPDNGTHGEGAVKHTANVIKPDAGINSTSSVPGTTSTATPAHHWDRRPTRTTLDPEYYSGDDKANYDKSEDPGPSVSSFNPRAHGSGPKGPTLQLCPPLVALGIMVLGIWW